MKLYELRPVDGLSIDDSPWLPFYEKSFGFIVRAENEEQARRIATEYGGKEIRKNKEAWLNPELSSCNELLPEGEADLVMRDFKRAL